MTQLQVKKVVAVCFLEAVKVTLEHLGARRLELSQQGQSGPEDLPRLYGDTRRLRDYLQRCVSSYRDAVSVELEPVAASLLVAACRRMVELIEYRLEERALAAEERTWLKQKIQVLSDWAVEVAEKPITELPLARVGMRSGDFSRALTTRIQGKVWGRVEDRKKIVPPKTADRGRAQGIGSFGDTLMAQGGDGADAAPPPRSAAVPLLVDSDKIQDPRIRALVALDLKSLERAQREGDHRMVAVLLGAIAESVLLDHAIPRRKEFGLTDTPDAWNLSDVLLRALGDEAQQKDRSYCFHLFTARNLLRPALQIVTPVVVTASSIQRLREFVARAFAVLGYSSGVNSAGEKRVLGEP